MAIPDEPISKMSIAEITKHFYALASFYKKNVNNDKKEVVFPALCAYYGAYFSRTGIGFLDWYDCPELFSRLHNVGF